MEMGNIDDIAVNKEPSSAIDALTLDIRQSLFRNRESIKLAQLVRSFELSNTISIIVFVFVLLWMIAVFCFLIYQANQPPAWRLVPMVIIALLTTTTANVLGLAYLVIKYVFHHRLQIN